jgi:hypothetical protein
MVGGGGLRQQQRKAGERKRIERGRRWRKGRNGRKGRRSRGKLVQVRERMVERDNKGGKSWGGGGDKRRMELE